MSAIVFATTASRKYHFDEKCKAFHNAQDLNDWDCEEYCSHLHPIPRALKRMSSDKAAMDGKLPCLVCVPIHLRAMPPLDADENFGHMSIEVDGDLICITCFTETTQGAIEPVFWPCTSAIVLGLEPREDAA